MDLVLGLETKWLRPITYNAFYDFGEKTRFGGKKSLCGFGGKIRFYESGEKTRFGGFGGKQVFAVLALAFLRF